jgi:hypothetical protein
MMRRLFCTLAVLIFTTCLLPGCATTSSALPRDGVTEARACQKALGTNPALMPGYIIRACTNNGVWVVDQVDPIAGGVAAKYDFVNGDYAGPETGYSSVPVESLGEDVIQSYKSLRVTLNKSLRETL